MMDWVTSLGEQAARGPLAMVSVLATEGSAPRGAGTRMLVSAETQHGTIGGGRLEYQAVEQARAILSHPAGAWRVQDYPLGPLLGQCCGGRVRLLVEHVDPAALDWIAKVADGRRLVTTLNDDGVTRHLAEDDASAAPSAALSARAEPLRTGAWWSERLGRHRRDLYLFGAGHVGQAIARHARDLPLRLAWFDTRAAFGELDGVTVVADDHIADCVAAAPDDAAIVILTHDHGLDYALVLAALRRPPVALVGVIGSVTKRARFLGRLTRDGVEAAARARLTCPIGVAGVTGKEPEVIAIATLAQLLQLDGAT